MSIYTYQNLYRAYLGCRKTKRKTANALRFEIDLENNLQALLNELKTRTYRPKRSICFVVTEPVPREIFAADFRDRVVHHLLIGEIIQYGERNFIHDSYACRPGKGTHRAVKRLEKFVRAGRGQNGKVYYLKLDVSGFFMSIDRQRLYEIVNRLALKQRRGEDWQRETLWLAQLIIFHDPTANYIVKGRLSLFDLIPDNKSLLKQPAGKGLPIGNYTSQFFANLYLNELDQFIKRNLKCRYYIRYVDDFILLQADKEKLKAWREAIDGFLRANLLARLNRDKCCLQPAERGIEFLGYFLKPAYTLVRRRVVGRLKRKLHEFAAYGSGADEIIASVNSYLGHFRHAAAFNLKKKILAEYEIS